MKKSLLISILALISAILILFILLAQYTDRVIDPYIRSFLEGTKPLNHRIEYKKIRVDLFHRYLIIKDTRMFPDSTLPENRVRIEAEVASIKLTDFSLSKMLFEKNLVIRDFVIDDPVVRITLPVQTDDALQDEIRDRKKSKAKKQLLKQIYLERVMMAGGKLQLFHQDTLLASSDQINFLAQAIHLERNSLEEPVGYSYDDISLSLRNMDIFSRSGLYDMKLDLFDFSKKDSLLILEGFRMIPKFDKKAFSKKLAFQNDRFDIRIGSVILSDIGLERWLAGEPLEISGILIDSVNADIYRDKNVAFNFNRYPKFYNESFLELDMPLIIDSLKISHSKIYYQELAEGKTEAGSILLADFHAQSYSLTNLVEEDSSDNRMHFHVQARVMEEGPLNAELILPLEGDLRDFKCSGSVGAMQLSPLNNMLEPSINMKFNAGKVKRMTFFFEANDHHSSGWMEFLYNDLDVVLLKKEAGKEWGFISFLADKVTHSNNPPPGKPVKVVSVGYERDKNKGIINYLWKTIQSGMIRTLAPTGKYAIKPPKEEKNRKRK